jgi:signal transduction histidine kinase
MRPRARFTIAFLFLQIIPIIVIGLIALSYTFKVVINEVVDTSDLMTRQVYEQVDTALARGHGADPATALQNDDALRGLLGSMQAFGTAVVLARVTDSDGKILVTAGDGTEGQIQPALPSVAELEQKASGWWPFSALSAFSGSKVYAATRTFDAEGKPFGTIYVGITTALLTDRMERLGLAFALIVIADVILTLLATTSLRRLLFREVWPFPQGSLPALVTDETAGPQGHQDELSGLAERFNRLSREVHSEHNRWETARNVYDMVRSIHDGVVLLDSTGLLLFANREARSALGLDKTVTVEGRPLAVLLRRNHPLVSMAEAALESGSEAQDVPFSLGANGESDRTSMLVSFFRLGTSRKPVGMLVLLRDMNAVRELESVVDYSNRLARLGGLISGVAHQLRSPLHGINLRLELLREDASRGNDIEKHINRLRSEVDRLDQSVEALLRFMRPQELKLSRFVLNDLLVELANRIKHDRVHFVQEFTTERPVEADRAMLSEAFANLIQNAVQAMPEGGVITISTAEKDGMVEAEISDQGIGIAPENLDQVLNLYFTTKRGGSGLGLPLALRAIELNRGTLKIDSKVGRGTACRVRLPAASDASVQLASSAT